MRNLPGAIGVAGLIVAGVCGCAQKTADAGLPAVLSAPTDAARAELARTVSQALNGAPVTLASDALTNDDTLIVERAARRDAKDMGLGGRELGRPDHFRLVKHGRRCVLIHVESARRWTLESAACSPR
ncbi:MAG TPA: hypothetical protein PLE61_13085 [Vicinamibacterales bacterium]|nr:hypothetical protein [Vicinamibacterales bacterium]